jgi:erythromycin esterase-like protein
MWRNTVVRDFVALAAPRQRRAPRREKVGFYGMDLYSLSTSIGAV